MGRCTVCLIRQLISPRLVLLSILLNRTGPHKAGHLFAADDVQPIDQFERHLNSVSQLYSTVYVDSTTWSTAKPRVEAINRSPGFIRRYMPGPPEADSIQSPGHSVLGNVNLRKVKPVMPLLSKLRAIKSPEEQRVMRAAADISGTAHAKVSNYCLIKK